MNTDTRHIIAFCMLGLCCFGSDESVKNALTTKWVSYAGGDYAPDAVHALATDVSTNAYFGGVLGSGFLANTDDVSTQDLLSGAGVGSGFVAKADADGTLVWASTLTYNWGVDLSSTIYGIAVTNEAIYACGLHNYEYDELGYLPFPWGDAMVNRLDAENGTLLWSHSLSQITGSTYEDTQSAYKAVAVEGSGAIYAVGYTTRTNLSSFSSLAGGKDAVIVKYASNGTLLWVRYLGGVNNDEANAVSVGADGLYVSGYTQSPGDWITLGNSTLPSESNRYGFLAKLDFDGAVIYTTVLGGNAHDEILSMTVLSNRVYLAGTTYSTNFCNAHQLNNSGGSKDGFVLQLTDYGTTYQTNWFRYVGTNTVDGVQSLALMDSNRVVVCGSTGVGGWMPEQDEFSRGYSGGADGFILQLNRDTGAPLWSTYVGAESNEVAYTLAVCGTSVFLGGTTGSDGWDMYGGFQDLWGDPELGHLNNETGFVGKWSQEPGVPPLITNDLSNVTVHEGESVEFFVGVSSKPAAQYYWLTNGVPAGGVSTNRYVLAAALPVHDGTFYQCIASNVFGCATSSVAQLTVIANGYLNVSITPPSAVTAGAKWRLDEGVWRNAGTLVLYPGTYTVSFTNLIGWVTPATRQVVVVSSQTNTVVGAYVAPVATAVRTVSSWTNVSVAVTCPPEVTAWTLVEQLPTNSVPTLYSPGVWNATGRTLTYTGSVSSAVSYTVLLGAPNDYTLTGSITSMPINVTMPVTGDNRVSRGNFLRKISGTNVWIYMFAPSVSMPWIVNEKLSGSLVAGAISPGGETYMDELGVINVEWFERSIGAGKILSYNVTGEEGSTNTLLGTCTYSGTTYPIYGDATVIIPMPPPVPPPPPTILNFTYNGASAFLTFTSVVDQAYMVLTNANLAVTNGWKNCTPVVGQAGTTTVPVPVVEPQLFYRVKSE